MGKVTQALGPVANPVWVTGPVKHEQHNVHRTSNPESRRCFEDAYNSRHVEFHVGEVLTHTMRLGRKTQTAILVLHWL